MKQVIKAAPVLVVLLFSTFVLRSQTTLNNGLVAYYPFNNNANDESGNNINPASVRVTYTTDRKGKANSACHFNGKTNYIRIPDNPRLHFSKGLSISAWVRVNGYYQGTCHGNRIIMKGYSDNDPNNYFLTFDDNYATGGSNCYTEKPDMKRQSFYAPFAPPVTNNFIEAGKWYLLTYVYDGSTAQLFVNCNLQGKGTRNRHIFSNTEDLFFGKMDHPQYPYWFSGDLDEVRIYNRPLTKAEINILCKDNFQSSSLSSPCTGNSKVAAAFTFNIINCNTVAFSLTESGNKNLDKAVWNFGDGTVSDKKNPVHTYKKYGTYKVRAIVTGKSGCKDTITKQVNLEPLGADFTCTETEQPGELSFRVKNNKASYQWSFADNEPRSFESVTSHRYTASGIYTVRLFASNNAGCRDTISKQIEVFLPDTAVAEPVSMVAPTIPIPKVPDGLQKRAKDLARIIEVSGDSITISLYDNGMIDGDSITLLYNEEIIAAKQVLTSKPLILRLPVDRSKSSNDLIMYAENLGSIPPNTALMIVYDGEKRYQVSISSTLRSNGAVSFIFKK
ncbi:MAG: PKD domain-containing protein [Chitinophagaceae bacterium]|nr:PKD domain-containing protein [Chitinophagaceae bacterium]